MKPGILKEIADPRAEQGKYKNELRSTWARK